MSKVTGPIKYEEHNNTIQSPANLKDVFCEFGGRNNKLIIADGATISNLLIQFPSDNGLVVIGDKTSIRGRVRAGYSSKVIIGEGVTSTTKIQIFTSEETVAIIGDDVMFASNVIVRTEDGHAIYDVSTGERINNSRDIKIGAHVWIAEDSMVLSGAEIGEGSTIGCMSVVKGKIHNNCVAAGAPAQVIKRDTIWERVNVAFSEPWVRNNAFEQKQKRNPYYTKTDESKEIVFGNGVDKLVKLYV